MAIKAIETVYRGYRFRSRLEARWAVFFDALGVPFEYEKEGFDLGDGVLYLPDFWLPDQDCWLEVKGTKPTADEVEKAKRLAVGTQKWVAVAVGEPQPYRVFSVQEPGEPPADVRFEGMLHYADKQGDWDGGIGWWYCPPCRRASLHWWASCDRCERIGDDPNPQVAKAANAARSARFEHGERP